NGSGMQLVQKIASNPKNTAMYQKYGADYINAVAREWIASMIGGLPSGMLGEVNWGQVGKSAVKTAADMAADFVPGGSTALNTAMGAYNTAMAGVNAYQQNAQQQQMLQQGQQAGIPANALQSWNPNIKAILDGSSLPKIQNIAVNPTNAKQYQKYGNKYMDMIATAYIKQAIQAQK
ncbi:MAG TPA: hypothetical protein PKA06_16275, partial [Gemmatales bacterium]|nr:hypothetical protein [Gemmatales bacterium]